MRVNNEMLTMKLNLALNALVLGLAIGGSAVMARPVGTICTYTCTSFACTTCIATCSGKGWEWCYANCLTNFGVCR